MAGIRCHRHRRDVVLGTRGHHHCHCHDMACCCGGGGGSSGDDSSGDGSSGGGALSGMLGLSLSLRRGDGWG